MTDTQSILACIREVSWAFEELEDAKTLSQQSAAYVRLSNAVSNLETWHPAFNIETGEIPDLDDTGAV